MVERATIARPYAKAAFEYARDTRGFDRWSRDFALAAQVVADPRIAELIGNPELTAADHASLLTDVAGDAFDAGFKNFVRVLAENHRLPLLPEIAAHFERLRSEAENTVDVEVVSAVPLDAAQTEKLKRALAGRLKAQVRMKNSVDAGLLGGALIRAGDLVIDGSLKGRLERLRTELTD
ncbi:MAG TPA: F0F1 ATP synthase subunit delta [Steroidobacteraceae bacterium]|nr:F0F1 ATP synthase subunit delta [Steroidobacteraceae bacterium]